MQQKLEDCQTHRHHKDCGKHKVEIMTKDINEYVDVPILSIVMCFLNALERTDITKSMPHITTVISCTGDAFLQTVHVDESKTTEQVVNAFAFTIRITLALACEAKDKKGYSINFTKVLDEYMREFAQIKDVRELKNKLNAIKERFMAME